MYRNSINLILNEIWPMLLISIVIAVSIRTAYLIMHKKIFKLYRELIYLGMIVYVLSLFYIVTFQDVSWSTSNFVPFKEILRYNFGSSLFFKNVLGNMLIFMPFGLFISYILKSKKIFPITLITLITSITIETTQLIIGRVFDIDDILLNVLGSLFGYYLFVLIEQIIPSKLKNEKVYNIILLLVIIFGIIYLGGWLFWIR